MEFAGLNLDRTWQYATYLSISLVALIFIVILLPSSEDYFRRFFGELNALVVVVFASIIGAVALWLLQEKFHFVLFMGDRTIQGLKMSAVLASALAILIVVADFFIRYPEDTNVPIPQALLFYPSVGFVAEILFHVLPLALLLILLNPLSSWIGKDRVVWGGILNEAFHEPTYQLVFGGKSFTWGSAYTWIHVFAIAFLQLYVFRRFDFVSMYSFRLIYYGYWHILWGVIRLRVLF